MTSRRRPDPFTNKCSPGHEVRNNKHGDPCCYKIKPPKAPPSQCPKDRTPPCKKGFQVKKNKKGVECCFKIRTKKSNL